MPIRSIASRPIATRSPRPGARRRRSEAGAVALSCPLPRPAQHVSFGASCEIPLSWEELLGRR